MSWPAGFPSSSGSGGKNFPHDIQSRSGLNQLYNQRVVSAQPVERPLAASSGGQIGGVGVWAANKLGVTTSISGQSDRATHSGVLVTTGGGEKYLVHKGDGYGKTSQTVVVDTKHMSSQWQNVGAGANVGGSKSVGDYVKDGGNNYSVKGENCHDATNKMMGH